MDQTSHYKLFSTIIPAKEEKKTTWIFIHGLFADGSSFERQARTEEMSLNSEIHLIDMRNHGRSGKTKTMSNEEVAMDIRHYADDHQIEKFNVFAFSFGGTAAIELCTNPKTNQGITSLVLQDVGPFSYSDSSKYPDIITVFY